MTSAVRHCMECRYQRFDPASTAKPSPPSAPAAATKGPIKDPIEIILELTYLMNSSNEIDTDPTIESLLSSIIKNPESVLQELDIQRLRAMIYRDVVRQDRNKAGKNVVIVVVNLTQYLSSFFAQLCFMSAIHRPSSSPRTTEIHSPHSFFVFLSLTRTIPNNRSSLPWPSSTSPRCSWSRAIETSSKATNPPCHERPRSPVHRRAYETVPTWMGMQIRRASMV